MENSSNSSRSSHLWKKILHAGKDILIASVIFFVIDLILKYVPLKGVQEFAMRIEKFNDRFMDNALRCSPFELWRVYSTNVSNDRYDWHFNNFSAPFNLTKNCIELQGRVYDTIEIKELQTDLIPLSPLPGNVIDYNRDLRKLTLLLNRQRLLNEPGYLQEKCRCPDTLVTAPMIYFDKITPDVNKDAYPHSIWEYILAIPDSFQTWIRNMWFDESQKPNWLGRVLLIIAIFAAIIETSGLDRKSNKKVSIVQLPFSFLWNYIKACFLLSLLLVVLFLVMKLIFFLTRGIARLSALAAGLMAGKGFFAIVLKETWDEISKTFKKRVLQKINPPPKISEGK